MAATTLHAAALLERLEQSGLNKTLLAGSPCAAMPRQMTCLGARRRHSQARAGLGPHVHGVATAPSAPFSFTVSTAARRVGCDGRE